MDFRKISPRVLGSSSLLRRNDLRWFWILWISTLEVYGGSRIKYLLSSLGECHHLSQSCPCD